MEMERATGSYISEEQKQSLIALVNSNPKLISGKFTSDFTKKDSQQLWVTIGNELNKIQGAVKPWTKWRKCYQDMRSNAKKKAADIGRYRRQTGGGPPCKDVFSEFDESVIALVPQGCITGHSDVPVRKLQYDPGCTEQLEFLEEDVFIVSKALKRESSEKFDEQPIDASSKISSSSTMQRSETKSCLDVGKVPAESPNKRRRLSSSSTRLEKSLLIGSAMSESSSRDCANQEKYYERKINLLHEHLDIMKQQTDIPKKQADAAKKQADALAQIADYLTKR